MEDNQTMTLEGFRQARESGVDLYQEAPEDAAPQTAESPEVEEQDFDGDDTPETFEDQPDGDDAPDNEGEDPDEYEIPKEQKNAFYKRAQRERKKAYEEARAQLEKEYEEKLNPYKSFFDRLGVDPQAAMEALEQQKMYQEAQQLGEYNGWTDEQIQMYVRQQQLERKQTEMEVNLRVYELADTPDYPGIKQMKGAITDFIRSNPRASVEQAYWAVGGQSLAQQLKREAEQREIAKRSKAKRTVITDAPNDMKGPEQLTPEAAEFMRRTGMSEDQVRMLMKDSGPKNLDEYRKMTKRKG